MNVPVILHRLALKPTFNILIMILSNLGVANVGWAICLVVSHGDTISVLSRQEHEPGLARLKSYPQDESLVTSRLAIKTNMVYIVDLTKSLKG